MPDGIVHQSLDGGLVTIECHGFDLSLPATSTLEVSVPGDELEFSAGPLPYGTTVAEDKSEISLTETYSYQGGQLKMGVRAEDTGASTRAGVWDGAHSSIYLETYNRTAAQVISTLDYFEIEDGALGVQMITSSPSVTLRTSPLLAKIVPGLGLLEIAELTSPVANNLPSWEGTPTVGGELFIEDLEGSAVDLLEGLSQPPQFYLVLVSPSARTIILPQAGVAPQDLVSAAAALRIAWQPQTATDD